MFLSDFDFALPDALIAQAPPEERGTSRLLVVRRDRGTWSHHHIGDLPRLLGRGDLLVVNDSRVMPARLVGRRESGGRVECLLLRRLDDERWDVLMHPGQKMKPGTHARFGAPPHELVAEVLARHTFGRRTVRLHAVGGQAVEAIIDLIGHVPLPPYIRRPDATSDRERYQTVYARVRGSVAAPTAGLHFTPRILDALDAQGVERAALTLHVGYGTFQPIRTETVEAHHIDPEVFEIGADAAAQVERARAEGRRVIAVGTTSTRTLEAVAREHGGRVVAASGEADLFIAPGFRSQVLGGLLTNFHLPKSSLFVLVCAFAGRDLAHAAYQAAIAERYRFYSYGDAMLIL